MLDWSSSLWAVSLCLERFSTDWGPLLFSEKGLKPCLDPNDFLLGGVWSDGGATTGSPTLLKSSLQSSILPVCITHLDEQEDELSASRSFDSQVHTWGSWLLRVRSLRLLTPVAELNGFWVTGVGIWIRAAEADYLAYCCCNCWRILDWAIPSVSLVNGLKTAVGDELSDEIALYIAWGNIKPLPIY